MFDFCCYLHNTMDWWKMRAGHFSTASVQFLFSVEIETISFLSCKYFVCFATWWLRKRTSTRRKCLESPHEKTGSKKRNKLAINEFFSSAFSLFFFCFFHFGLKISCTKHISNNSMHTQNTFGFYYFALVGSANNEFSFHHS